MSNIGSYFCCRRFRVTRAQQFPPNGVILSYRHEFHPRPALRLPHATQIPWLLPSGTRHAGTWNLGEHGDFFTLLPGPAAQPSGSREDTVPSI
jgi:hypothetical protein